MIEIEIPKEAFLPCYHHLLESEADINLLWGGRDSGKSHFIGQKMLIDCLSKDYFRCVLIKKTYESIKDAQWAMIKDIANSWNIEHLFTFNKSPLEIICVNGNRFISRGLDKPEKLKSITNPSHVWMEEANQADEEDYAVITTTLRSNKGKVQEWLSFNPECNGNFKDFWIYKNWFSQTNALTFNTTKEIEINDQRVNFKITSTHTTYSDNIFCTPERIARHEELKNYNPYRYGVFTKGMWGNKENKNQFLYAYSDDDHYKDEFYQIKSDQELWLSFDFNKDPCTLIVSQYDAHSRIYNTFDILTANHKERVSQIPLDALCMKFLKKYEESGLSEKRLWKITGDVTGLSSSASHAEVHGNYTKICKLLDISFRRQVVLWRKINLPHTASRDLCNEFLYRLKGYYYIWKGAQQLSEEMKLAYADEKGTLNEAKAKEGLHVLDCGRYQIDAWFRFENYSLMIDKFLEKVK